MQYLDKLRSSNTLEQQEGIMQFTYKWSSVVRLRGPPLCFPLLFGGRLLFIQGLHDSALGCSDLESYIPPDFKSDPVNFLPKIKDEAVRSWALALHHLWPQLCRKVTQQPDLHAICIGRVSGMLAWILRAG